MAAVDQQHQGKNQQRALPSYMLAGKRDHETDSGTGQVIREREMEDVGPDVQDARALGYRNDCGYWQSVDQEESGTGKSKEHRPAI
jgi:hypothetical protein